MITLKLPYKVDSKCSKQTINNFIDNFNSVLRYTYNRLYDSQKNLSTKELTALQSRMSNIFIDSHFKNSAIFEAKSLFNKNKSNKIIFGGKKLFQERNKHKITSEEFKIRRSLPLTSIGEALYRGNRKFQILSDAKILFKPNKYAHIELILPSLRKNYKRKILQLISLQNSKTIPITYKLDSNYVYISFSEKAERSLDSFIENRVFAIDLNPNYIGWSVVEWKDSDNYTLIKSGIVSIKDLNDKDFSLKSKKLTSTSKERLHISNKRKYETVGIASYLVGLVSYYRCSVFTIEDLNIASSDKGKGKKYNRLTNNCWNRVLLTRQVEKRCSLLKINFIKVKANYSSFVGNLAYRQLNKPDMVLSSIEIGRRGFEFYHQYIKKDKNKEKNIIFNNSEKNIDSIVQSLEELNYRTSLKSIESIYKEIKNSKLRYRVPLDESLKFFSLKHNKSLLKSIVL